MTSETDVEMLEKGFGNLPDGLMPATETTNFEGISDNVEPEFPDDWTQEDIEYFFEQE